MTITLEIDPKMEAGLRAALACQDMAAARQLLAGAATRHLEELFGHDTSRDRMAEGVAPAHHGENASGLARALDRESREARDLEILNRNADALNRELEDFLTFQVDW